MKLIIDISNINLYGPSIAPGFNRGFWGFWGFCGLGLILIRNGLKPIPIDETEYFLLELKPFNRIN